MTPNPPPPTSAARGTVATTWTAAVRTPAAIVGTASGNWTDPTTRAGDIPVPLAASRTSASTSRIPTYTLVKIGGIAKAATATTVARFPNHIVEIAKIVRRDSGGRGHEVWS